MIPTPAVLAAALLLSGCVGGVRKPLEADLRPLPAVFPADLPTVPETALPVWEASFPSRELAADIQRLREDNLEVTAAVARVKAAEAAYGIQRAAQSPSLDALAEFSRERESAPGGERRGNLIRLGAALNWEPDIWGRLQALENAAALELETQQSLMEQTVWELRGLLVESWIEQQSAAALEKTLRAQVQTDRGIQDLLDLRFRQGQKYQALIK